MAKTSLTKRNLTIMPIAGPTARRAIIHRTTVNHQSQHAAAKETFDTEAQYWARKMKSRRKLHSYCIDSGRGYKRIRCWPPSTPRVLLLSHVLDNGIAGSTEMRISISWKRAAVTIESLNCPRLWVPWSYVGGVRLFLQNSSLSRKESAIPILRKVWLGTIALIGKAGLQSFLCLESELTTSRVRSRHPLHKLVEGLARSPLRWEAKMAEWLVTEPTTRRIPLRLPLVLGYHANLPLTASCSIAMDDLISLIFQSG